MLYLAFLPRSHDLTLFIFMKNPGNSVNTLDSADRRLEWRCCQGERGLVSRSEMGLRAALGSEASRGGVPGAVLDLPKAAGRVSGKAPTVSFPSCPHEKA